MLKYTIPLGCDRTRFLHIWRIVVIKPKWKYLVYILIVKTSHHLILGLLLHNSGFHHLPCVEIWLDILNFYYLLFIFYLILCQSPGKVKLLTFVTHNVPHNNVNVTNLLHNIIHPWLLKRVLIHTQQLD